MIQFDVEINQEALDEFIEYRTEVSEAWLLVGQKEYLNNDK